MKTNRAMKRLPTGLAALMPLALLASCTMGPDYQKPAVQVVSTYRAQLGPTEAASIADLAWWQVFDDPHLQALVNDAVANNYDLRIAVARIEQARAMVGVARSEALPQVGYDVVGGRERSYAPSPGDPDSQEFSTITGLLNATWELDVWGRIRRSTEAAQANLMAQEDVRRGVMLTLVTDVAAGYFHLLELDRELAIAQESSVAFGKTLELFTLRYKAGRDNELPVQRTQAAYDSSSAHVEDVRRQIAQQENALSILTGSSPRDIARGRGLTQQKMPATPVGATSDLLQRRPDILAAEQRMIAANAEIGVAVADFFPRIGLSALLGGQGVDIGDNSATFGLWSLGLSATGPIFSGGRLESMYKARQAYWDETVAQYQKTVIVAFQEVSDSLAAQQQLAKQRTALESQVTALQQSVSLALLRYDGGRASYFEVLEAQQQLYPAQAELARTQRDQLLATVSLYKALGGGWQLPSEQWSTQPAPSVQAAPIKERS